jgi:hypothetical protein
MSKNIKKVNRYHLSVVSLLILGSVMIACVWLWFELKNRELEERFQDHREHAGSKLVYESNNQN